MRTTPVISNRTKVMPIEISREGRHPSVFEKKTNMRGSGTHAAVTQSAIGD
jgi:hypothetical protein